jgi:large subunit ribosomal protein L20
MPRATDGTRRKNRRKKITSQTKGYWGRRKNAFRTAKDALEKSLGYAYRDRKVRKRDFRRLWITRISAACKPHGITYSRFIEGLTKAEYAIDRKVISNLAIEDPDAFAALVDTAKKHVSK